MTPPHFVKPMLATTVDDAFDRDGWLFEVKWDGYRAIAEIKKGQVRLYTRNQKSLNEAYAPIVRSLEKLEHDAIIDGEIVVLDDGGKSHFQLLQNYLKTRRGALVYYVFDLISLDGKDLRKEPLRRRKQLLQKLVARLPNVRFSEHVETHGKAFFDSAGKHGLEGILAKNADSPYREGIRGRDWLKIKTHRRQEAVIGGYTEPRGSRKSLGALVLGVYEGDELVYVGHTGTGFDTRTLADVHARLTPLEQPTSPFTRRPKTNAPVHWVKPALVCEVRFQEWSDDGLMRMPVFLGLREDKEPKTVRREKERPVQEVVDMKPERSNSATNTTADSAPTVKLTNLNKVYWPDEGYTKGDLIEYYDSVADFILPYLKDRPQSLNRHPDGITRENFFQKDVSRTPPPPWVRTVSIHSGHAGRDIRFIVGDDRPTLLYLANLGCIELNPWHSRMQSLERPDYAVIDLDPEQIAFAEVVKAAIEVRKTLKKVGAPCFCKTSGKRGLHIYVPLGAKYDYEQAKSFAEIVANFVHARLPHTTSVIRQPARRQGRVYLDYLQNPRGQTLAVAYSVRPHRGATVSTPLKWSEVSRRLDPSRFTIRTVPKRLDKVGDLWEGVLGDGIDLGACLARLRS
jgi:bifunctional non-homologous end joining protein LigD